jgi:predicted  nucleic acid-binding Zn-ribbon protein
MPRMDAEIAHLEGRLDKLIALYEASRSDLRAARVLIAELETENAALRNRLKAATERLEAILERLPQPEPDDV